MSAREPKRPANRCTPEQNASEIDALLSTLDRARSAFGPLLNTTQEQWNKCVERLRKLGLQPPDEIYDEQLWTWLLACGYAAAGLSGLKRLTAALTEGAESAAPGHSVWLEVQPPSPRLNEGNTHLDLALGHIAARESTDAGIDAARDPSWICFCEMKGTVKLMRSR